ncbi:leucine-rich repeat serine/threonine-protein kinase 2 isoform X2 [Polypterus senegalus]|uniref:leucine-rich repeat serine/threonine-protein kinase 2 isoform X2 n=1 Tax=Polypterus senegalus TaxID=55291 RepID=UPI0019632B0D|nr:leucine-rich repeat serine/threonine-protein kinase 2 isoform X2 [Polypterus senegalus]
MKRMACKDNREEQLKKLIVRLKNTQEDKPIETLIQILEDLLFLTFAEDLEEHFADKQLHDPLSTVLKTFIDNAGVQQVGWSLLCRLIEICPSTLDKLSASKNVSSIHMQILRILAVHSGHVKLMMIGLRALSLLLYSDAIVLLTLDDEVDVFYLIVSAMNTFCFNEEVQLYGCKSLQLLLERVADEHLIEFVETGDHMAILNTIKQFQNNEDTVLQALKALLPLAGPISNVEVLMSGNERCYSLIMSAMESFSKNEKVQEIGCCLFQKFTSESFHNILVLNGVHKFIIKAAMMYQTNAKLQASALMCLASLTETIVLNKDLNEYKEEDDLCWIDVCCRALDLHIGSKEVQAATCWALNNLLVYESKLHEMFGDEDGRYPVHLQVMAAMLLHSSSKEVFQATANTLATMAGQNVKIRSVLLSSGIHINIFELMKKHIGFPEVAESACRLLYNLFQVNVACLDVATMAMAEILNAMKVHKCSPSVQLEALRAALLFVSSDKSGKTKMSLQCDIEESDMINVTLKVIKNQCVLEGAHTLVLDTLNKFIGSPVIQDCGLRVLCSLVDCSGALELMSQQGAIDTILHTLQMYPDEKEINWLGLNLLCCLFPKKKLSLGTIAILCSVLVKSLLRFREVLEVQLWGFRAVLALLETSPASAEQLERESFDLFIFQQVNFSPLEERFNQMQKLYCMCLSILATDGEIRHRMLEKACAEDNFVMAECLIHLGADVNKKTKNESLIYKVCEKECSSELVELLLNSGTHEQDIRKALFISVKKRNNLIISLILRKLGLDQANSAICLGGFRLGHLESSWLNPLFSERKTLNFRQQTSKGMSLVRVIMKYQKQRNLSKSVTSNLDTFGSGYMSDEADDSGFVTEGSSVFMNEDIESDESSGIFYRLKKIQSDSVTESSSLRHRRSRRPSSEVEIAESEPNPLFQMKYLKASTSQRSKYTSPSRSPELSSLLGIEKECIKLLDLSGNDLDNVNAFCGKTTLNCYLEQVQRLELHHNNLLEFPEKICEVMKHLTHLDLHSNRFTIFPFYMMKMPCLIYLNISRNEIASLTLDSKIRSSSLKQLVLSFNSISFLPDNLGRVLESLEELQLEGNNLTDLNIHLFLSELKLLDISKNNISVISDNVLSDCLRLEMLNASRNTLCSSPRLPLKLTTLNLSYNKFTCVPDVVLHLPYLRSVDMRNNDISLLPGPSQWESVNLRELIFSYNQISVLNLEEGVFKWSRLEKLHLCKNKLKEIPPQIGLLENLSSFDVSNNSDLKCFPDEMGKLERLWDLPLDGLQLDLDLKHIGSKTKDIIRFLQQRLKKAVPYYRMKLMLVGNTGSGKTTLLHRLMKLKRLRSRSERTTVGIDVKDWKIQDKGKTNIVLNVWDFSGREEFYSSHPHFMTQRALYLVVYDVSKGVTEVDAIKPWLFNIKARAPSSPVILIGTHADVSDEKHQEACTWKISSELLNNFGFPIIREHHLINAKDESDSIGKLRKAIVKEIMNFKIRDQPVMGQLIPYSYLELEKRILQERKKVAAEFPVICHSRLLDIVVENQILLEENELSHAVHFLNESGVLLHFEDPALQFRDLYFVDPQWLCNIISQILTIKGGSNSKFPKGIIQRSDVEKCILQHKNFPKNYISQYFKLLERFQIALPLGEEQLLIPSSLSDQKPVIELPHCENSEIIVRLYEMPYFPMGFWSRLINRLLEVSSFFFAGREKALRLNRMYWRQGIYLNWSPEAYCLVESDILDNETESFLRITVPSAQRGRILLGQIVDHIDSLLEEWFPGLLATDICREGGTLLKKWAVYSFGDDQRCQKILLDDLLDCADKDCLLVNPEDSRSTIPISQIAPDLILADLPENIMLISDQLEMDLTAEYLLGDGGFGSVYHAVYKNEDVAVKIFNKHASEMYLHRLLRQELAVLSHLHHPSLISLLAVGYQPRMLVMELAPKGSLDTLFNQKKSNLNKTLQHRIALHVADGLRYLHSSMIIYRDLKPHNILLFNFKTNSEIIAKISDYGISQYCCSMGIKTSEGTPGFRAPEVARGNVIYNKQADVYSFGLLLYDILTCGERILDGLRFPSEFDEIAVQGNLPDPVKHYNCSPWPQFESLINDCMKENPDERPTSAQIFNILNSAELLCLIKEVKVPTEALNENDVASCLICSGETAWIGSGNKHKGRILRLDMETGKYDTKPAPDCLITCLTLVHLPDEESDWLVSGTESGRLLVFSAANSAAKHELQEMSSAITSLLFYSQPKHSKEMNFLLAGIADGSLAVFNDAAIKCTEGRPQKIFHIGNVNTPVVCLSEFAYSQDKNTIWAGCGSKIVSLTSDFEIWKTVDTKPNYQLQHRSFSEANITTMVIDKYIYLSKQGSHIVEIWDKKTEKMSGLINCSGIIKDESKRTPKLFLAADDQVSRVTSLHLQQNVTLWIGTERGHIILIDLATRQHIKVISGFWTSVISITVSQMERYGPKNVVVILGNHCHRLHEQERNFLLSAWNCALPLEVQNLKKHVETREQIAIKMKLGSIEQI